MFHVDNNSAVPVMPVVKPVVSAVTSFFTEGGNGVPPTYPGPDWFNIIQSELLAILAAAGIIPDKASNVQLLAAMRVLFLDASQNGADIQDKAAFLQNLGLGEGSALPVGVPVPYPLAVPPAGWMKCNGSPFNLTSFPALAAVFPSGVLPDLRGEFIRGWDDGSGVDAGRGVLSSQGAQVGTFYAELAIISATLSGGTGAKFTDSVRLGQTSSNITVDNNNDENASGNVTINPADTRPRNIAFNYIVRAA